MVFVSAVALVLQPREAKIPQKSARDLHMCPQLLLITSGPLRVPSDSSCSCCGGSSRFSMVLATVQVWPLKGTSRNICSCVEMESLQLGEAALLGSGLVRVCSVLLPGWRWVSVLSCPSTPNCSAGLSGRARSEQSVPRCVG